MRAPVLIALTVVAQTAAACATVEPVAAPPAVVSAPPPTENHDWFLGIEEDQAGLDYGLEESDDIWLSLSCRRSSGRLELSRPVGVGHPPTITVESGGLIGTYSATSESSELHDGVFLTGGNQLKLTAVVGGTGGAASAL